MSHILTIVGARPQFVKAAIVSKALADAGIKEEIIHTGQHYDHEMSTVFWDELGIPTPTINLNVGSGSHGAQTGIMIQKIEEYILKNKPIPKALLVYGDTNSTLAGAVVASKLHIPIVHVEAGLRSFNREMPEEVNRILTDHISTFLFCSSSEGVQHLKREGIVEGVHNVGDVMYDAILTFSKIADDKFSLADILPFGTNKYILATIHRPSNTDSDIHLEQILDAFSKIDRPIVWPVHPRNKRVLETKKIPSNLHLIEPLSYFKMMVALKNAHKVITDSGGLQKEAYWMEKPCITVREETEWVETLDGDWNQLTGADSHKIITAVRKDPSSEWKPLYGDGDASNQIASYLKKILVE